MDDQLSESIGFVRDLAGTASTYQAFEERETAKSIALEEMFGKLTPEVKEQIREGLSLRVAKKGKLRSALKSMPLVGDSKLVDRVGSKELQDTEADLADGYGLDASDAKLANEALQKLLEITRHALGRKDKLGNPLFSSPDQVETEVFTPLVRQGVLPDNFVIGKYSEVQKLLDATFAGYKQRLQDVSDDEQVQSAKIKADAAGAGSMLDKAKGVIGNWGEKVSRVLDKYTTEEERREFLFAGDAFLLGVPAFFMFVNVSGWVPNEDGDIRAVNTADRRLNPEDYLDTLSEERLAELGSDPDPDEVSLALAEERRNDRLEAYISEIAGALKLSGVSAEDIRNVVGVMTAAIDARESEPGRFTEAGIAETINAIEMAVRSVKFGIDEYLLGDKLDKGKKAALRVAALREALKRANGAVIRAVKPFGPIVVTALENSLLRYVDTAKLVGAVADTPDSEPLVRTFQSALERTIAAAAPLDMPSVQSVFEQGGKSVAAAFAAAADVKQWNATLAKHPEDISKLLPAAIETAITNGVTKELADMWRDSDVARGMLGKSVAVDDETALQEVERARAETAEFERQLVLIDEVGELAADKKAIDKLINHLEKRRTILEFAAGASSALAGMASGGVNMAAAATEAITFSLAGTIVGPIKAAKLIVQFSVQIYESYKCAQLLKKFYDGAKAAKKADSPLFSAIAGLRDNKVEQLLFHTIDDALTAVQVATNIVGAIPNEYAMAIGMTTTMIAATAQKTAQLANAVYSEVQLREAWKVTLDALDAPSNRELGLKALKLNPTLSVHALAWAGFQKQPVDPIARMMLKKLGLSEQSLAASGTETKVRKYLETVLYEDRQLLDPTKVVTDWALKSVTLSTRDWFLTVSRATKVAVPKLNAGTDQAVTEALKVTDQQDLAGLRQELAEVVDQATEVRRLEKEAKDSGVPNEQRVERMTAVVRKAVSLLDKVNEYQTKVADLRDALAQYVPLTTDGAPHVEMKAQVAEFQKLAARRRDELTDIETTLDDIM